MKKIIDELNRRINWFEEKYHFEKDTNINDAQNKYQIAAYGKYKNLILIRNQIKNKLFINGAIE